MPGSQIKKREKGGAIRCIDREKGTASRGYLPKENELWCLKGFQIETSVSKKKGGSVIAW